MRSSLLLEESICSPPLGFAGATARSSEEDRKNLSAAQAGLGRSGSSPTWFWRCYEPQNDPPRNAALAKAAPPTANLANQYFMGSPP